MPLSIVQSTELCRLLADTSRLRLLLLLEVHDLSVAELTQITGLAQSRVSTHLAKLRRAGLVADRREGAASIYSAGELTIDHPARVLWEQLRQGIDDAQQALDHSKAQEVIAARKAGKTWAETVAGRMESHYSPGRTWEATARALIGLLELGDVLDLASGDGVLAELIADHARSVHCVDISPTVLQAAQKRLARRPTVKFVQADMHALPLPDSSFDHVFAMHALSYTNNGAAVLAESARLLRPGGRLIISALARHQHEAVRSAYDHANLGINVQELETALGKAGLQVQDCRIRSREQRPPYFEVIAALATKADA